MITIRKIVLKDGKTVRWQARGVSAGKHPDGKRRQVTITGRTKREVGAEVARITGQVGDGTYVPRWDGTVSQLCDDYEQSAAFERAANTALSYHTALLPVRQRLGPRKARSVTRQDLEGLRDWMLSEGRKRGGKPGTGLGPRSVRMTLGRLSAAFEMACRDGHLAANPARYVRLPSQPRRTGTTWSEADLRTFLSVADSDRLAAAWRLTLYGLRRGEACGLRWDDIDLDARTVAIGRARVPVNGKVIEKAPKSERGVRTLPLDDVLTGTLRALRKQQAAEKLAAGPAYTASGYAVADELGRPVSPEWFSDEFQRVAARAGVPRIRLHDGRHTVSSLMAAQGIPDHIRAAWCGHTVAVNVATYTHARPEDLAAAGAALSRICGAV